MPGSFPPVFKELSSSPEFVVEQVLAAAQRYVYASLLTPGRHLRNICWMNKLFFWEDWLLIKNPFPLFITSYIPFPHFILKTAVLGWPPLGTRHAGITVLSFTKWGGWKYAWTRSPGEGLETRLLAALPVLCQDSPPLRTTASVDWGCPMNQLWG